jgi:hypothetical protein
MDERANPAKVIAAAREAKEANMRVCAARINDNYWLVVVKEPSGLWAVQVWGAIPFKHDGRHASVEEAQAAAPKIATDYFEAIGSPAHLPDPLIWKIAVEAG